MTLLLRPQTIIFCSVFLSSYLWGFYLNTARNFELLSILCDGRHGRFSEIFFEHVFCVVTMTVDVRYVLTFNSDKQ